MLHLWSLGIEEQFYIFFPFIVYLLWKKGFRESFFIALILTLSLVYNFHLEQKDQVADFYSPLSRFWELLIGAVLACLSRVSSDSWPHRAASKINGLLISIFYKDPAQAKDEALLSDVLSALGLAMIAASIFFFRGGQPWPGHGALLPSLGAAMIIAAGANGFLNRRLLANRLAISIGLISYPLYLWHWPLYSYLRILSGGIPDLLHKVAAIAIAFALAALTYKLVERPFRFGVKFRGMKTMSLGLLIIIVAAAGLFIHRKDGLPDRGRMSLYTYEEKALHAM